MTFIKGRLIHLGWVQTHMDGGSAPFTVEQAAAEFFRGIKARPESGKFWNVETFVFKDLLARHGVQ